MSASFLREPTRGFGCEQEPEAHDARRDKLEPKWDAPNFWPARDVKVHPVCSHVSMHVRVRMQDIQLMK